VFFFFPYATDAPIYHRPIATIGLIVANILAFVAVGGGPTERNAHLWLAWGDGLHPFQWLSSNFVHGDFFHLAGNMIFLWVFGLVVEGKIGWWRFLACYLGVGVGQSMVEQILTLALPGINVRSGGASSAIFGIMAMAAIWAPANEITCGYFAGLGWMIRTGTFDVTIGLWAAGFVALNLLQLLWGSLTGLLHLMGAAFGAPLAILMLKAGAVDCEADELAALEAPAESAPLVSVSAQANPLPENMAAPTPRATANPPTRPTNNDAPMISSRSGTEPEGHINPTCVQLWANLRNSQQLASGGRISPSLRTLSNPDRVSIGPPLRLNRQMPADHQ